MLTGKAPSPFDVGQPLSTRNTYLGGMGYFFLTGYVSPKAGALKSFEMDMQFSGGNIALFTHNGSGVVNRISENKVAVGGLSTYAIADLPVDLGEYLGLWMESGTSNGIGYGFNGGTAYIRGVNVAKPVNGTNLLGSGSTFNGQNILLLAHGLA